MLDQIKNIKLQTIKDFVIKNKLIVSLIVFFVVLILFWIFLYVFKDTDKNLVVEAVQTENTDEFDEEVLRKRINGEIVKNQEQENFLPVAIMVENSIDCWPQSGLAEADIIYEALVEGSITRFMAIYANDQDIEKIGPVRSARPYYLEWSMAYGSPYLHVGGSPEALKMITDYGIKDVNQFYHPYFWRSNSRYAPHNVYTSSQMIVDMEEDREYFDVLDYQIWQYQDELDQEERSRNFEIKVRYSNGGMYDVNWVYDYESNEYTRFQGGYLHKMSDGQALTAKNIIIMLNNTSVIDEVGRKKIQTVGENKTWIFSQGQVLEGKWIKKSVDEREVFYDENGDEVKLIGGLTWIMSVPDEEMVSY